MADKEVFLNIDHKNRAIPVPHPNRVKDVDTKNTLYKNIMELLDSDLLDLNSISAFTTISQTRDQVYNMLDVMTEDPMISAAVNIYASDACEPNEDGHIVWAESDDELAAGMVNHLLDVLNVDKNIYDWVHSLVKYGDLYLRLFRQSEYEDDIFQERKLNEDVILKKYKNEDHFAEYIEMHNNPAEIFDLQKLGKTVGYINAHVVQLNVTDDIYSQYLATRQQYDFNRGDIDLYSADQFVHACLKDNSNRLCEEVNISSDNENKVTYKVKRGQSILYNVFRVWRELSLLENSVVLNRITKSAIVRILSVEVGDMEKNDVRNLMQRIKSMVEQKSAINIGKTYEDYTNPGPVENIIYVPTHDGKGAITATDIGGQAEPGQLTDLTYFKNKLNAGLGIPGAFLGESDSDGSLFNNGNSLSLKSSMYAKTVKRIQNTIIQALTDAVNILLLDKGLNSYINKFTIKMQAPTTQEEKDRKDNMTTTINNVREIMSLVDGIEDQATKLTILKQLLPQVTSIPEIMQALQDEIDRLTTGATEETGGGEESFDFGGEEPMGMEMPTEEPATEEPPAEPTAMEAPSEEGFETEGGQLLTEDDILPSWNDLGMSYTDYKA